MNVFWPRYLAAPLSLPPRRDAIDGPFHQPAGRKDPHVFRRETADQPRECIDEALAEGTPREDLELRETELRAPLPFHLGMRNERWWELGLGHVTQRLREIDAFLERPSEALLEVRRARRAEPELRHLDELATLPQEIP